MRNHSRNNVLLMAAALVATTMPLCAQANANKDRDMAPNGKGIGTRLHPGRTSGVTGPARTGGAKTSGNGIFYHGGPLILNGVNTHIIWYGNWSGNSATTILPAFLSSEGGSPYFNINTTYYNGSGTKVRNAVAAPTQVNDSYSKGTALTDADIQAIVAATNPTDTNGVYFVLTSADVNETSGFCTSYCGWHTHASINGKDIKYSFVGNPDRCPTSCEEQSASSPNNNPGADGMASVIAHELEEAVTDPDLNAWYDRRGYENADKCAWTFGTESTASNGSKYNITLGGKEYLIQRNWVDAGGGYCSMSY